MPQVAVSAVVVNHSRERLLDACLRSLGEALEQLDAGVELIVVDNGSRDRSRELVRERHPNVQLVELGANRGFATGAMEGIGRSRGEWILLLNNDATIEPDAVAEMLAVGRGGPDIGSVAGQLRFAREPPTINSAGIEVDRLGVAYDRLLGAPPEASEAQPTDIFGASAGAALYRRSMLEQIGGFDTSFFMYLEDVDLAWRARMYGWRSVYAPRAIVHHHHSATARHGSDFKYFHVARNRVRLLAKNADRRQLRRYGLAIVAYDTAYVAFVAASDRTLAPLRGRLRGLRTWRVDRRRSGPRRAVELAPPRGLGAALGRRSVWLARGDDAGRQPGASSTVCR